MTSYKARNRHERTVKLPPKIPGWQLLWAGWMQRRSERIPRSGKVAIWLLFVLLAGGYSCWLIIGGFSGKRESTFTISPIRTPAYATQPGKAHKAVISKQEFERIHRFHVQMDSLSLSPEGKKRYEMIVKQRPGLMDSIRTIEELYRVQVGMP